jgi:enamine deaminase RidA (YjgF/YER057c/UK114 family)
MRSQGARDPLLAEPYPASTVVVVAGLALPEFLVEIEAVAAQGWP